MYNASATIIKSIESVLRQSYNGLVEIIVINDGSTDDSLEIVTKYRQINNITNLVIINKENGGVSSARNNGLKGANGEFIALLDSDDEWLPEKLEQQMQIFERNPDIEFLGCARNNEVLKILGSRIDRLHKATVKQLLIKMYPQTSTAIFKRKLYDNYGGYNESMTHAEDGELWIRYCARSNFYYHPESLVITGNGKPSFGHSGLSANLRAMELGYEFILLQARKQKLISTSFFLLVYCFSKLKYLRRLLIVKFR